MIERSEAKLEPSLLALQGLQGLQGSGTNYQSVAHGLIISKNHSCRSANNDRLKTRAAILDILTLLSPCLDDNLT